MAHVRSDGRGKALAAVSGAVFLSIGTQMIYPVLLPHFRTTFGFDLATAGALLTALWLANAFGQLPGGLITDWIGNRIVLTVGMIVTAFGLVFLVSTESTPVLFLATALLGFGVALSGVARYTAIRDVYPERLGTAAGVTMAAADAGQTILPPLAGFLAVTIAWQYGFGMTIPLFLLLAVWLWFTIPAPTSDQSTGADETNGTLSSMHHALESLDNPAVYLGTAIFTIYGTVWAVFTGFYPTYLIEVKGLSGTIASLLFGLFFAIGVLVKPVAGAAYDRIGVRRSLVLVVSLPTIAFGLVPSVTSVWTLVLLTIFIAPILGNGAIIQPYVIDALPDEITGSGLGLVRTIAFSITAVSPAIFGAIAQRGFFDELFYLLAILAASNLVLAAVVPRPVKR